MTLIDPNEDVDLMHTTPTGQKFWLGSRPDSYLRIKVPVVICACKRIADNSRSHRVLLMVPLNDSRYLGDQPSLEDLEIVINAMHALIGDRDVFVHCEAGMNRSALLLTLYLMTHHGREFQGHEDIVAKLRKARSPLLQNSHFERIVVEWAWKLRGRG